MARIWNYIGERRSWKVSQFNQIEFTQHTGGMFGGPQFEKGDWIAYTHNTNGNPILIRVDSDMETDQSIHKGYRDWYEKTWDISFFGKPGFTAMWTEDAEQVAKMFEEHNLFTCWTAMLQFKSKFARYQDDKEYLVYDEQTMLSLDVKVPA